MPCPLCTSPVSSVTCPACASWYQRRYGSVPRTPEGGARLRMADADAVAETHIASCHWCRSEAERRGEQIPALAPVTRPDVLQDAFGSLMGWEPGRIPSRMRVTTTPAMEARRA